MPAHTPLCSSLVSGPVKAQEDEDDSEDDDSEAKYFRNLVAVLPSLKFIPHRPTHSSSVSPALLSLSLSLSHMRCACHAFLLTHLDAKEQVDHAKRGGCLAPTPLEAGGWRSWIGKALWQRGRLEVAASCFRSALNSELIVPSCAARKAGLASLVEEHWHWCPCLSPPATARIHKAGHKIHSAGRGLPRTSHARSASAMLRVGPGCGRDALRSA